MGCFFWQIQKLASIILLIPSFNHARAIPLSIASLKPKIEYLEEAVRSLSNAQKQHGSVIHKSVLLKAQEDIFFCRQGYNNLAYFLRPLLSKKNEIFLGTFNGDLISETQFGLFHAEKITSLKNALNNITKARANMVHITKRIANETYINAQHIAALDQVTKDIASEVPLLLLMI